MAVQEPELSAESYAELQRKVAQLEQEGTRQQGELAEAFGQLTAIADVLRIVGRSTFDLQLVLETLLETACRLCNADRAVIYQFDGACMRLAAITGAAPEERKAIEEHPIRAGRESAIGRLILEQRTVHIPDVLTDPDYNNAIRQVIPFRTVLGVPMLRDGELRGGLLFWRNVVQPFSEREIELLETFADQAAIAIENTRLFQELEERNRDLAETLEQQTATSEILRVIASSPTDLQAVLDIVVEKAARLCEASGASVSLIDGGVVRSASRYGSLEAAYNATSGFRGIDRPLSRDWPTGRAAVDRQTIHLPDLAAASEIEFPRSQMFVQQHGHRSGVWTPMLRDGVAIGTLAVGRQQIGPFSDRQIQLLRTLADQAVIAIENTRLFQELRDRNRDLGEALEQQTATSEVLRVIATSPTELQPVLDALVESAARLCETDVAELNNLEATILRRVASCGRDTPEVETERTVTRGLVIGRAVLDGRTVHVRDLALERAADFPDSRFGRLHHFRALLAIPLIRQGVVSGVMAVGRREPRPFTDKQIALAETFADQAVIAIENTRLFQELQGSNRDLAEALEQQTATSEVLKVISRSTFDLQLVLDTLLENACRLCDAPRGTMTRAEGVRSHQLAASYNVGPETIEYLQRASFGANRETVTGRVMLERRTVQIDDIEADPEFGLREAVSVEHPRTVVGVPMLRQGNLIGVIAMWKHVVEPFTPRQIELAETFADQAVIAIENTRLLGELQSRVEQLEALSEIGQAVSSSLDLERVLEAIVAHAVELSNTAGGGIYEYDEATQTFELRATHLLDDEMVEALHASPMRLGEGATGRSAASRATIQIPDLQIEGAYQGPLRDILLRSGSRALLAIPLLRDEQVLGGLTVVRHSPGEFPAEVVSLLETFASQSALAIQNARLFREIEEKSRELEEASRHKSEFLANMSHELRTPLNAILGYTELIVDGIYGEPPETIREVLERVERSGRHLLGLINDVLDLSKMEAGQLELALDDYSMDLVIQTAVSAVGSLAAEEGLALEIELAPDLPPGRGDERRLTQVLLNLLGNALKFTEVGRVAVLARASEGQFTVAVSDTGPGISAEDQARIFEEFQQVDSSSTSAKGGTGLGLSIARRIVALHGGTIRVESRLGEGSTFTLTVPVRVERAGGA